jgi:dihydroxy-acid dehydratase
MEDVNRAGGIMSILGELDRAGLINTNVKRVDGTLKEIIDLYDLKSSNCTEEARNIYRSGPAGKERNLFMGSQNTSYEQLDLDRSNGCIRSIENPYSKDGGLAVLFGNIARNGCIVKTAGVDESIFKFSGKAMVYDSQEEACEGILNEIQAGDVVVIGMKGLKVAPECRRCFILLHISNPVIWASNVLLSLMDVSLGELPGSLSAYFP